VAPWPAATLLSPELLIVAPAAITKAAILPKRVLDDTLMTAPLAAALNADVRLPLKVERSTIADVLPARAATPVGTVELNV